MAKNVIVAFVKFQSGIQFERLRKTTYNLSIYISCLGRYLNPESSDYYVQLLTIKFLASVKALSWIGNVLLGIIN